MPFVLDENVLGKWRTVGFVENIDDFSESTMSQDELWLKSVCFYEDGRAIRVYEDETWIDR